MSRRFLFWGNSLEPVSDAFWADMERPYSRELAWVAHNQGATAIRRAAPASFYGGCWLYPYALEVVFDNDAAKLGFDNAFPIKSVLEPKLFEESSDWPIVS